MGKKYLVDKYLVDTNALFNFTDVLEDYKDKLVVPSHVLREIEHLELTRKSDDILQEQIRIAKRFLKNSNSLYIDLKDYTFNLRDEWDGNYTDNILVQICVENGYGMISNDNLLNEKCKLYGVEVVNLQGNDSFVNNKGFKTISINKDSQYDLLEDNSNALGLAINEYLVVNDEDGDLLNILKWNGTKLVSLLNDKNKFDFNIRSEQFGKFETKDEFQVMAVDSILKNQLTMIRGRAGSGKSLIALSVAWHLVEKEGYKLVIFVNPVPSKHAQELGFYKGDRLNKLLQSSVGTMLKSKFGDEESILHMILDNKLEILPYVDLRGYDTGDKTICWVLEAQNLTSELMKLGLQRLGEGSKMIVDGDFHQQVDKEIYTYKNGMKRMSEVFRGLDLYGEVELQNVWRSRVAEIADSM